MNLLEQVFAATESLTVSAPVIVSEQHDVDAINWVAGVTDPGEMIACGYRPELRRLAGETDAVYLARVTPLMKALPIQEQKIIMGAAKKRASLDVSNGRVSVMTAGELPWHGLGTVVQSAVSSADAMRLANIDWRVGKSKARYLAGETIRESESTYILYREDTGAELGSCGKLYTPQQNAEGFDFLDEVLEAYGARYETAGAIFGGKQVWMQAHLPANRFEVLPGDEIEPYVIFTLDHTGRGANRCYPTTQRVVCANTFRVSGRDSGKGIRINHFPNLKQRVTEAKKALGLAVDSIDEFKDAASAMVRVETEPRVFVNNVLDQVLDITEAEALKGADVLAAALKKTDADRELAAKKIQKEIDKRESIMDEILRRYDEGRCTPAGSTWAAFNAVTEFVDHTKQRRFQGTEASSRRFEHLLTGDGDEMKQVAYNLAIETIRA